MSREFGAELKELIVSGNRFRRYFTCLTRTAQIILSGDYDQIFVQNPSIVLAAFAVSLCNAKKLTVVVDAHNAGVYPKEGKSKALARICKWINRNASFVIVSNKYLASQIERVGGRAIVLPDPLPGIFHRTGEIFPLEGQVKLFVVCTWAEDEPIAELIDAAALLPDGFTMNFSGKCSRGYEYGNKRNVALLGFLSYADYTVAMSCADLVIDLTTRDDCLVCGAYESLALGKPVLLSDTRVNRQIFREGAVYCRPRTADIVQEIISATGMLAQLQKDARNYRETYRLEWQMKKNNVMQILNDR